jgi:Xaa-Pro aminopeptidase
MDYEGRVARVRETLPDVDALLVTNLTNVRYLTGFSGSNGQLLVTRAHAVFMTDPRYEARAGDLVEGAEISVYPAAVTDVLGDLLRRDNVTRLGIEAATMTLSGRDDLDTRLDGVALVPTKGVVERLRRVKDAAEIAALRRAVALGDRAYEVVLDRLVPGATERHIALELEIFIRNEGADHVSFDPIVGSGPLSAHIHHTPSERPFEKGDLVLLDFGSRIDGYCSDLTRTVVLGPATDEQRAIYDTVLESNRAGTAALAPGAPCADVDRAARAVIADAGHAERFGHGLGHGVGLDIHESPRLHRVSEESLLAGDVVTIEPGIYVPGSGGIRIEDCVLVTEDGPEVLTRAPNDTLIEL